MRRNYPGKKWEKSVPAEGTEMVDARSSSAHVRNFGSSQESSECARVTRGGEGVWQGPIMQGTGDQGN